MVGKNTDQDAQLNRLAIIKFLFESFKLVAYSCKVILTCKA